MSPLTQDFKPPRVLVPAGSLGGLHEATLGPHTVFKIKVNFPSNVSKSLTLFSMGFTAPGKGTPAINVLEREWTEVHDRRYGEVAVYSMETIHFKCMLNGRNVARTLGNSHLLLLLSQALPGTVVIFIVPFSHLITALHCLVST